MVVNDDDFKARLAALGFGPEARTALLSQGLRTTRDMLNLLSTTEVEKCITHLQAEQRNIVSKDPKNPQPKAAFPNMIAVKNMKAFYLWICFREVQGQALTASEFRNDTMKTWISRKAELDWSKNDGEPPEPSPLISFDDWLTFEETLFTWCANTRSPMTQVPFSYLLRSHTDVTKEMRTTTYDLIDDDLINTMLLMGPNVLHNNCQLYHHLKGWMQDGPAWSFMQVYNRNRDGRGAYLAVKAQAEGQAALMSRKAKAYAFLAAARYTGRTKSFSFDSYIIKHQKAHNELFNLEEPLTETKKVQDFLAGIHNPAFVTFKGIVLGDTAKMSNFEACQQYLKTCDNVTKTSSLQSANSKREVAAIKTTLKKKGSKPNKGTKNGPDSPPHYGHYSSEDYRKLNSKHRKKLRAKRTADGKGGGKRKAAAVTVDNKDDGEVDETPPKKLKTTKTVTISVGSLKMTGTKKAQLKTTGEETEADTKAADTQDDSTVIPFNPDTHGPWYDWGFGEWEHGFGDDYPMYEGYDVKARAKAFKAYHHLDVFEREDDPVWTFNQPDQKTFEQKLQNTFDRRIGVEDQDENEKYCKAVGMEIKRFGKAISKGRNAYVAHIKRMNNKAIVRCPLYHAGGPLQRFRLERNTHVPPLYGDLKTQRLYYEQPRLKNLETHPSCVDFHGQETANKMFEQSERSIIDGLNFAQFVRASCVDFHGQETADKMFEQSERSIIDGLNFAQFVRASSSKTKGKYGKNHGSED